MATAPIHSPEPEREGRQLLPEYLPARMLNEYAYCPRLFYLEWVDGLFRSNADTLEGQQQHRRVDGGSGALPPSSEAEEKLHARSVTLASATHHLIARMDLVELEGTAATPVDYKHGAPQETPGGLSAWPSDVAQLAAQGLVLRENGFTCQEGVVYYAKTKQRIRVPLDSETYSAAAALVRKALETSAAPTPPAPLEDSPKCIRCSLAGFCLPDETNALLDADGEVCAQLSLFGGPEPVPRKPVRGEVRRLMAPRDDLKPLYVNTQGLHIGKSGTVLQVKEKGNTIQTVRMGETCQVNLMGNVQLTTQAIQGLCEAGIPICYFSQGGWFYGITTGLCTKNVFLRQRQFELAAKERFALELACSLTAGKIRNQRTMLLRNHVEPPKESLEKMKELAAEAERARNLEELLGFEGNAARIYFGAFSGMLKDAGEQAAETTAFRFDFHCRNRRPPRDPINALLSLGYSLLAKDLSIACYAVGFDPMMGYFHQPRFGRPALALDLMEPFRPLIADSAVLSAVNTRMVQPGHFVKAGHSVALTPEGRKSFYRAYESRMDTMVTHPLFGYRVSYRRLLEIQTRLLARVLEGEFGKYPVFVTR